MLKFKKTLVYIVIFTLTFQSFLPVLQLVNFKAAAAEVETPVSAPVSYVEEVVVEEITEEPVFEESVVTVNALAETEVIVKETNLNTQNWYKVPVAGGNGSIIEDSSAIRGIGSLQLTTDSDTLSKVTYSLFPVNLSLNSVLDSGNPISYYTKYVSGPDTIAAVSYQIAVDFTPNDTSTGFTTLVYEPYHNGTISTTEWQQWDLLSDTAKLWSTRTVGTLTAGGGGAPFYTLDQVNTENPDAVILYISLNVGSNNPNYQVLTDEVRFNGVVYNFESNPTVNVDYSTAELFRDGYSCALGDALGNDFLSIKLTGWNPTEYDVYGRYFTGGSNVYGNFILLDGYAVDNSLLKLDNNGNSPAGVGQWNVVVVLAGANPNIAGNIIDEDTESSILSSNASSQECGGLLSLQCTNNSSWATSIYDFNQGLRKNGTDVLAARSNPLNLLNSNNSNFFSFGFGGGVVVKFANPITNLLGNDITIYEVTGGNRNTYPLENALVEASVDGITYVELGSMQSLTPTTSFDLQDSGINGVIYLKITDTSNPAIHANDGDGIDIDAIKVNCGNQAPIVSVGNGNDSTETPNDQSFGLTGTPIANLPANDYPQHNSTIVTDGSLEVLATIKDTNLQSYHLRMLREDQVDTHSCGDALTDTGNQGLGGCGYVFNQAVVDSENFDNDQIAVIDVSELEDGYYWLVLGAIDTEGARTAGPTSNSNFWHQDPKIRIEIDNPEMGTIIVNKFLVNESFEPIDDEQLFDVYLESLYLEDKRIFVEDYQDENTLTGQIQDNGEQQITTVFNVEPGYYAVTEESEEGFVNMGCYSFSFYEGEGFEVPSDGFFLEVRPEFYVENGEEVEVYCFNMKLDEEEPVDLEPSVLINFTPSAVTTFGTNITLTGVGSGGDGVLSYSWSCTTGETSNTSTVILSSIGARDCTVTVVDEDGDDATAVGTFTINPVPNNPTNNPTNNSGGVGGPGNILGDNNTEQENQEIAELASSGEILGVTQCTNTQMVSGFVYIDLNGNNAKDSDERGLGNIRLKISYNVVKEDGSVEKVTIDETTDSNGKWETELCVGEYNIELNITDLPDNTELGGENNFDFEVRGENDSKDINFAAYQTPAQTNLSPLFCLVPAAILALFGAIYFLTERNKKKQEQIS